MYRYTVIDLLRFYICIPPLTHANTHDADSREGTFRYYKSSLKGKDNIKRVTLLRSDVNDKFQCHCDYEHENKKRFAEHASTCHSYYLDEEEEEEREGEGGDTQGAEDAIMGRTDENIQSVSLIDPRLRLIGDDNKGGLAVVTSLSTTESLIVCYVCQSIIPVSHYLYPLSLSISHKYHTLPPSPPCICRLQKLVALTSYHVGIETSMKL
jgi:hypothetical protein